jgi:hypothetical protein
MSSIFVEVLFPISSFLFPFMRCTFFLPSNQLSLVPFFYLPQCLLYFRRFFSLSPHFLFLSCSVLFPSHPTNLHWFHSFIYPNVFYVSRGFFSLVPLFFSFARCTFFLLSNQPSLVPNFLFALMFFKFVGFFFCFPPFYTSISRAKQFLSLLYNLPCCQSFCCKMYNQKVDRPTLCKLWLHRQGLNNCCIDSLSESTHALHECMPPMP